MPEQLIQWSPVKLKLDGSASFVIQGDLSLKQETRERSSVNCIQDIGI